MSDKKRKFPIKSIKKLSDSFKKLGDNVKKVLRSWGGKDASN